MSAPDRRPVIALALAQAISLGGTRLSMIAIPWLALTTTGDPVITGLVGLAEMLPYVLAKALGGPLIDRLGARRIAATADIVSMFVLALVPALHLAGLLTIGLLIPIVVLVGVLRGPADGAKHAMVPAVAAAANLPLERVTGLISTVERLASVIGALAAGALVAAIGAANALLVNALSCGLGAIVILIGLRLAAPPAALPDRESYVAQLRGGWRYFRADPVLVGIVMMVAMTNLFDQAFAGILLPVWAERTGDVTLLGLALAVFSGASIAGSAIATLLGERLPRLPVYTIAFLVCGAPRYLAFALDLPFIGIIAALVAAGFASGFLNPILGAVMFERIPPAFVGRVSSIVDALCWALLPFGGLVGGLLIAAIGLPMAFAVMGLAYLAVTMLPLGLRSFRDFNRRPGATSPAA